MGGHLVDQSLIVLQGQYSPAGPDLRFSIPYDAKKERRARDRGSAPWTAAAGRRLEFPRHAESCSAPTRLILPSTFATRLWEGLRPIVRRRRQAAAVQGGLRPHIQTPNADRPLGLRRPYCHAISESIHRRYDSDLSGHVPWVQGPRRQAILDSRRLSRP
jgi:hypothetical protein